MNRKRKGTAAERELVHAFWKAAGWAAVRVAGSGSMRYPSPDVIASDGARRLVIECKSCEGDTQYVDREQVDALAAFAQRFDAQAYIAVRFSGGQWWFLAPQEMKEADRSLVVVRSLAEAIGRDFSQLIAPAERATKGL